MAYDEGLADMLREDLGDRAGITERRMFGGLCFMLEGHMLCGVMADHGMYRVGKPREDEPLTLEGVIPMARTGRPMGGIVEVAPEAMADDGLRLRLLDLALANVQSLPAK
ncbi:TfoX/Sxy family protein [Histidinibacterium aquaticum]|uniref:TfoX/Sxy family protein n=1 Tax=Histidinibacterium aquaticum TaxID=2613962 RepID=A0A5J5GL81_9RHOB|nr:TfoX/Sxy family protein [Histidinibacterium aquaticum]KAA9009086.1 TfoX/Sxy family protein [Histidinibacterium aquaticum]